MENSILKMAASWAIDRLLERNTWAAWLAVAAAKFGQHLDPAFDTLLINGALALVAIASYAIKGQPIFTPVKK